MGKVVTKELTKYIEEIETDAIYSRLSKIKMIANNPMGVEIRKYGNATAFTVQNIPGPSFNKVKGMMDEDLAYLDDIINFYEEKGIPPRFELTPAHATSPLYSSLTKRGLFHNDFLTNLYADPQILSDYENEYQSISIREFNGDEFDLFAELYVSAFNMPKFLKENIANNNKVLHGSLEWKFYLACYQGEPAGMGVLYIGEKGAYLAAAGTIPSYRNKGIQGKLIRYRMKEAQQRNCQLIVGQANFGTSSQNNMERAGLKIAYTKSVWTHQS